MLGGAAVERDGDLLVPLHVRHTLQAAVLVVVVQAARTNERIKRRKRVYQEKLSTHRKRTTTCG